MAGPPPRPGRAGVGASHGGGTNAPAAVATAKPAEAGHEPVAKVAEAAHDPAPKPVESGHEPVAKKPAGEGHEPKVPPSTPPHAPAPAPAHGAGSGPGPEGESGAGAPGVASQVLHEKNMLFASTNLIMSDLEQRRAAARKAEIEKFEQILENARRLRTAKMYEEALPSFMAVLNGNAPDDLKRAALLELALIAQERNELPRALQVLSQYLTRWPQDPSAPEILLRQGLIYRQLGINQMALSKFYATMTSSLVVKDELFDYYKRLVLQAQAEIAETLAMQSQHAEAARAFARLLKEESPTLNRVRVHYRYIQSLAAQGKLSETVGQAQLFLSKYPDVAEQPEVRFLLATALKKLNRKSEALLEIHRLLASQQGEARDHPESLAFWQQRTGNEIANQLYQEGDFVHALDIYQSLLILNSTPDWQFPLRYQIGLAYERLEQPAKAAESYGAIVAMGKDLGTNAAPALKTTLDMAKWRQDFLKWQERAEASRRGLGSLIDSAPTSGSVTNSL